MNKMQDLLLVQLENKDNINEYDSAEITIKLISDNCNPQHIFHKLLLMKYRYKISIDDTCKKMSALLDNREKEVLECVSIRNDGDLWYLLGEGYKQKGMTHESSTCFSISLILSNKKCYYSDSKYPLYNIMTWAIKCQNKLLLSNVVSRENNMSLNFLIVKALIYFIECYDLVSIEFMYNNLSVDDLIKTHPSFNNISALNLACATNKIKIVDFFLSKVDNLSENNDIGITPIENAAIRCSREDGDENILRIILEKYRDTQTEINKELLLSCHTKLQSGAEWMVTQYEEYVKVILRIDVDWCKNQRINA